MLAKQNLSDAQITLKKLAIALDTLKKLSLPLVGEWHCNLANRALYEIQNLDKQKERTKPT